MKTSLQIALSLGALLVAITSAGVSAQSAQEFTPELSGSAPIVPQQIRYAGRLTTRAGDTVEAVFRIYSAQEGGEPLWTETQHIAIAEDGSYTVLLGSATPSGLPQTVFAGGAARWLGVSIERGAEMERSLLSSVPYAMKSADAESLAGHAASDFVTRNEFAALQAAQTAQAASAVQGAQPEVSPTVTGSGTANTIPLWTGTSTIGNSLITQSGKSIGINIATPASTLDVDGGVTVRGDLNLPAPAKATASKGEPSNLFEFSSSAWSSTANAAEGETFFMVADPTGNNTASPSATLNFQFKNGSAAPATVFSVAGNGIMTFSPAQTFPGTISSVTGASPITATTTSGAVKVGLDTATLESTLNAVYPQLTAPENQFFGTLSATIGLGSNYTAINGLGSNGSTGTFGGSDSGYGLEGTTGSGTGVYGTSTSTGYAGYFINNTISSPAIWVENDAAGNPGLGIAVKAVVTSAHAIGVLGKALSDNSYGVYGEDLGGTDSYGVYAGATGPGSTAVYGIASGGADGNNVYGSGVVGISTSGNGVEGSSQGASATGAGLAPSGAWGVWGDVGDLTDTAIAAAILGTADENSAAFLLNNGSSATLVANNGGQGGAGSFGGSSTWQQFPTLTATNSSTGGAGEMDNSSNNAVTLYLSNNGTGGVTDQVARAAGTASGALFKTLMASTPTGTCGIGGDGDLSCTGQVKSLISTAGGARKVETYAMQSPENWMEDFGTGTLQKGAAVVTIDPAFAETVAGDASYHVFLTPRGDSDGLYVINATPTTFEVRESKGGTSSLSFDYRIVAKRRGYETQRLRDVTESFNAARASVVRPKKPALAARPAPNAAGIARSRAAASALLAAEEAPERAPLRPHFPTESGKQPTPAPATHP